MTQKRIVNGLAGSAMIALVLGTGILPGAAHAQSGKARFELRPHCIESTEARNAGFAGKLPDIDQLITGEGGRCATYHIRDPLLRETPVLRAGDALDMDLIIRQPAAVPIHRIRVWIAYDPTILKGDILELSDDWTELFPGEEDFAPEEGYVKIGVGAGENGIEEKNIFVARIRFNVIATPVPSTILSFYDQTTGPDGHTVAVSGMETDEVNVLLLEQESLMVRLEGTDETNGTEGTTMDEVEAPGNKLPPVQQSNASVPSVISPNPPVRNPQAKSDLPPPLSPSPENPFPLLQVQNVAVTTEDDTVYLAWDPLASKELIGYNVTYGATSGQYIQKRSVDASATSTTIRGLPRGALYYFAVRGVGTTSEESAFSREVAVVVGDPTSSTAPLSASVIRPQGPAPRTPRLAGAVPGATGMASVATLLLALSATIGTILAFRRQFSIHTTNP